MRLADTRLSPPNYKQLKSALAQANAVCEWVLGENALKEQVLENIDVIVLSPGLSPYEPKLAALIRIAKDKQIICTNELELFAQQLSLAKEKHQYQPQIIAITGTNGKTTVATMVAHMLRSYGVRVQLAGNISPPLMQAWLKAQEQECWPQVWVIECSSFQLHFMAAFQPLVGCVLNISQDHLDWHLNAIDYEKDKQRLLLGAMRIVLNADDAIVLQMGEKLSKSKSCWFFGLSEPQQKKTIGLAVDTVEHPWICMRDEHANQKLLLPVSALQVLGQHNVANALAAVALLAASGWPVKNMVQALADYSGEPHRCQWIRTIQQVQFVNDSKGTNVGATAAAIEGLKGQKLLIAGGLGKGQDFGPLAQAVKNGRVRHSFLYGADAEQIAHAFAKKNLSYTLVENMQVAVSAAFSMAKAQEVILFSPACASMDQFSNYIERGQAFIEEVTELALQHGEII